MAAGVWKGVYNKVFGRSRQLSLNKFLDPSTPSLRKVDNGEKKEKEKRMSFIVITNLVASKPPEHRLTETPHTCAN